MGTRIRALLGAAAVVFGLATGAAAQSGPLRGVVHDHTGTPMPGAVVTIAHPQQTAVRVVLTDLRGEYAVGELERGTRYKVDISHPEFRKVRLQASAGERVHVTLKPRRSCRSASRQEADAGRR
jgi:hypothetical protein